MNQTDPIADMLTRIRNANMIRADTVEMPHSKIKATIARIMKREGFIRDFTTEGRGHNRILRIFLKFTEDNKPVIRGLLRVSKPGLRRYVSAKSMRSVKSGTGIAIVSTSAGLLSDAEVREKNIGGELLCMIW